MHLLYCLIIFRAKGGPPRESLKTYCEPRPVVMLEVYTFVMYIEYIRCTTPQADTLVSDIHCVASIHYIRNNSRLVVGPCSEQRQENSFWMRHVLGPPPFASRQYILSHANCGDVPGIGYIISFNCFAVIFYTR